MKYHNLFNLDGKITVVTGGAGLIGKELVKGLAESGAVVVIADTDADKGRKLARELTGRRLDVIFRRLDITKEMSVSRVIDFIDRKYDRIDIWINSAYPKTEDWNARFENTSKTSWRKNVDMHLNGCFICCQKAAEYMKKRKRGSVINFASIYGIVGPDFSVYRSTEMMMPAAYSAIKGGIITFTKYLASYYGDCNVRVNCISPGGVYDNQNAVFVKRYSEKVPLKRMAGVEDIVGGILYLSSDAAKYVTGHNLVIDGGWSIV